MVHRIAVVHQPTDEEKGVIQRQLESVADVTFLDGLPAPERLEALEQADVIIAAGCSFKEIRPEEIQSIRKAKLLQLIYAGANAVPYARLPEDIIVASNPGAFADALGEHVLAMILALAKSLLKKHGELARDTFDPTTYNTYLKGGVCGIIGFGGNGKRIAELAGALGMTVLAVNRSGVTEAPVAFIGTLADLERVLKQSDVVVLTLPQTNKTLDLIGERELGWMKTDAVLINVARGGIVNQRALYDHMKAHPEFKVGIDTWWAEPSTHGAFTLEYPFFEMDNFIGSPHIADHVPGMDAKATGVALENVRRFLAGERIRGVIDRGEYC